MKKLGIKCAFALIILVAIIVDYSVSCSAKSITITCYGDSVTEGVKMEDFHTAVIGGSTYPSILYTMLHENRIDAVVENEGHSGEKTGAIVARLGGVNMTLTEDISFDNNCAGSIDNKIVAMYNSNLNVPVSFNIRHTDNSAFTIDGVQYYVKGKIVDDGKREMYLYKYPENTLTAIKAGASVQLTGITTSNVVIIFAGINDDKSVTIDDYVAMLKNGVAASGGKYVILGPHSKVYDRQGFVNGSTSEERRENYRSRMTSEFGDHFIDLNTEWCERALSIAQEYGYFSDLSDEQISNIRIKLSNRRIPAEFTINNTDGNVHLNKAGYTVIAKLVYERLRLLKYI